MRVTPITAEEADEQSIGDPFPPGDYDFMITAAEEGLSKAGNEQVKLTLRIFNRDGHERTVFDYLSASPKAAWKLRHFAEAIGMVRQYETGDMPVHEMTSRPGRCKLRIKPAEGQYSAQNAVNDYLAGKAAPAAHHAPAATPAKQKVPAGDIDDEIPF